MKILRITSLGYEGGGAENGIKLLTPVFTKMGHQVRVLASNHRPDIPHFNDYEFKAFEYQPGILKPFYRCFYPNSYFALRRVLKQYQPDIVQLHTMYQVSPSVLFLLKKYPTILTIHGAEDYTMKLLLWAFPLRFFKSERRSMQRKDLNWKGALHHTYHRYISRPIYRLAFKNVDRFLVLSKFMQQSLREEGIDAVYIPNATKLFTPAPLPVDKKLLYVGRLEKIKGVQYLIRALPSIQEKHPETVLVVAGTGDYEDKLRTLVAKLCLEESVHFVGHITREQLQISYAEAILLVVPSIWPEPFGKVGIEAMSIGRPVIGTDVGGISEWLRDGETGYLVPPENSDAIAHRINSLLSDQALLERMSATSREQAKKFDIEKHAKALLKLYKTLITN